MSKFFLFFWVSLIVCMAGTSACAKGRKPDNKNSYPDYNKLEYRERKSAPAETAPSQVGPGIVIPTTTTPLNTPKEDEAPQPPPKPVFMPDDSSEPPMPDDMQNTLIKSTTTP